MKVFAVFAESLAGVVKIWSRSWAARGWTPQLISHKEIEAHGSPRAAAKARGGGFLSHLFVINFSYPARRRPRVRTVKQGAPGWTEAPLVRFPPGVTEQDIRDCGRAL